MTQSEPDWTVEELNEFIALAKQAMKDTARFGTQQSVQGTLLTRMGFSSGKEALDYFRAEKVRLQRHLRGEGTIRRTKLRVVRTEH